jgi:hypothetical protein
MKTVLINHQKFIIGRFSDVRIGETFTIGRGMHGRVEYIKKTATSAVARTDLFDILSLRVGKKRKVSPLKTVTFDWMRSESI